MAMIELSAWGENMITVQSVQESWAIGKAETLSKYIGSFERKIATQYRKRGLTMNAFRSEEHTSELQSLMRISYAVFCLKKKHKTQTNTKLHKTTQNNTNKQHR